MYIAVINPGIQLQYSGFQNGRIENTLFPDIPFPVIFGFVCIDRIERIVFRIVLQVPEQIHIIGRRDIGKQNHLAFTHRCIHHLCTL